MKNRIGMFLSALVAVICTVGLIMVMFSSCEKERLQPKAATTNPLYTPH